MRKMVWIGLVALMSVLYLTGSALAVPALGGAWQGNVKKVTDTACTSVAVSLSLTQCAKTNLAKGTMTVGGVPVKVVIKVNPADNSVQIDGSEWDMKTGEFKSVIAMGKYVAGSPAKMVLDFFDFSASTGDTVGGNQAFDVLNLIKQ